MSSIAGQEHVGQGGALVDGQVSLYDEHEDSCYAVAWSLGDPWLFASSSYDGRVSINTVPRNVKVRSESCARTSATLTQRSTLQYKIMV